MTDSEAAITVVQATAEGVTPGVQVDKVTLARSVPFMGKRFRIAGKTGLMPLLKFAHAASSGIDTSDMRSLAALYEMLRDCIQGEAGEPGTDGYDPGDWDAFERHAVERKADAEDLLPVVQATIELLTARPTQPPPGSSDGAPATSGNSTATSSSIPATALNGSHPARPATSPSPTT